MLGSLRSIFKSKIGVALTLAFLALIAIAFASADITGSSFGGVAGGDRVAVVGGQKIGTATLSQAASNAFERAREQNPQLTMQRFVAAGAVGQVLDDLIDHSAVFAFAKRHGITASDRLIDSEIAQIPAFQGPDGKFSEQAYRQLLAQQRLTDQQVREDLAQGLVAKQVLVPVSFGARLPQTLVTRYAALSRERRRGAIAFVPSAAFAPKAPPADQVLQQFYAANRSAYIRPERRTIRYASFGEEAMGNVAAPTEAEVARAYAEKRDAYAPSETRTIQQVVLPTQEAAQAFVAELRGGASLEAAARAKGLLPSTASVTRQALSAQASLPVADAVFAAGPGSIAGPARSGLGWHVARVVSVASNPGKSLEQARAEIVADLTAGKRRTALSEFSARIEEQFDDGANLNDVAREMGLTVATTEPLLANGQVAGKPGSTAPAELARVLPTAFLMDRENEPQLAEVEPGRRFVMFDVAEIVPAAPPPLAEIRERVAQDWALAQGSVQARAAADKLVAALGRRASLAEAMRGAGAPLPAPQTIDASRQELAGSGRQVPPPLALMFGMAKGTAKRIAAPARQGWFVVKLDEIVPGAVAADDPQLAAISRELGLLAGREYAEQFRRALRQEVGVQRNEAAVRAVAKQLTGAGQ
jgi:peptidyl-prolyl cis-trans isomerase D